MKSYKPKKPTTSLIAVNEGYIGERIEQKIDRIVNNKEPITDGAPIIYTERKHGVMPDYDIRTDKWEHAIDGTDKITKSRLAKREKGIGDRDAQKEGYKDAADKAAKIAQAAKDAQTGNNQ